MAYLLTQFDDLILPDRNVTSDGSAADARDSFVSLSADGAVRVYGSDDAPSEQGVLSKRATLQAATPMALSVSLRAIKAKKNTVARLWRTWFDGQREWTTAEFYRLREPRGFGPKTILPLEFGFKQTNPYWYAETPGSYTGTLTFIEVPGDEDSLTTLGVDIGTNAGVFTIENEGNKPATRVMITVRNGTADITRLNFYNITNGYAVSWAGTVPAGREIVINCGAKSVVVDGSSDWSGLNEPNQAWWMALAPEDNEIRVNGRMESDGTAEIVFQWEHTSC